MGGRGRAPERLRSPLARPHGQARGRVAAGAGPVAAPARSSMSARTAIPGIVAKPVIDLMAQVMDMSFLAQRTGRSDDVRAQDLAVELEFLPLALVQAAAVIAAQHLDYPAYLARLRAVPLQDALKRPAEEPYPYGVAEAIVLALDAVADGETTGMCRDLINVVALLSAACVSRALLYAAGKQSRLQPPGPGMGARRRVKGWRSR